MRQYAAVIPMQWSATKVERGHAAAGGECCCAQHDARHALHHHNLQHAADFYLYLYLYLY